MNRTNLVNAIKYTCIALAFLVAIPVSTYFTLNSSTVQNKLLRQLTSLLSERLGTEVTIDSVSVTLLSMDIALYGTHIADLNRREMLHIGRLTADVDLWQLLNREVKINNADVRDLKATLIKTQSDTAGNWQFLVTALNDNEHRGGPKLTIDFNRLDINNIHVTYNDNELSLDKGQLTFHDGKADATLHDATASWQKRGKTGVVTQYKATVQTVAMVNSHTIDIKALNINSDNRLPRKNTGRPNRGFFDAGHLNITADMHLTLFHAAGDSMELTLDRCTALDSVSGIDLKDVRCAVTAYKRVIHLSDVTIRQKNTELRFADGEIRLGDHSSDTPLSYSTSTITGDVQLRDIARAFSPALRNFTLPLKLSTRLTGNNDEITFHEVHVNTADHKVTVASTGTVSGLSLHDSHAVKVHFDVKHATVVAGMKEVIVKQFPVKRFMMYQLHALGNIRYTGSFDVLWHRQLFRGHLFTATGAMDFNVDFDHENKYMTGTLSTDSLEAGVILGMKDIGYVAGNADFKIDISKERTEALRRSNGGGKLPIGEASAHVSRASYKFVSTHNLDVSLESDGAVANGSVIAPARFIDLGCSFIFTDTDNLHKMKIKPGISFHRSR